MRGLARTAWYNWWAALVAAPMLRSFFTLALAVAMTVWLPVNLQHTRPGDVANPIHDNLKRATYSPSELVKEPEPVVTQVEPEKPQEAPAVQPEPAMKSEPKPQPAVVCGPHDPLEIYNILIDIGVPHLAAVQQVGSWTHESGLDQCQKRGDGGIAWGLNSWHPNRRRDMPAGLQEQVNWAVHTEMRRDCPSCYTQFMAAESVWSIRDAIKRSTRWGILGNRWLYADQFGLRF